MGERYQPCNGSEGDGFIGEFCSRCVRDDQEDTMCNILGRTMAYDVDDEQYPSEWTYDKDGRPVCTAFEVRLA